MQGPDTRVHVPRCMVGRDQSARHPDDRTMAGRADRLARAGGYVHVWHTMMRVQEKSANSVRGVSLYGDGPHPTPGTKPLRRGQQGFE